MLVAPRSTLFALLPALLLIACRSEKTPVGGGRDGGTQMVGDCPGEGTTICALKLSSSSRHPELGGPVVLSRVVVSTPTTAITRVNGVVTLAGFYVQDPSGADFLSGRYSGVAITYKPAEVVGTVPAVGSVVNIEGVYGEYGQEGYDKQKQVEAARIEATGETLAIDPVTIDSPQLIGNGGQDAVAYEGVLVKVQEVSALMGDSLTGINSPCSDKGPTSVVINGSQLCGAFRIDPSLVVSGLMFQYRNPQVGEQFTSISGVLRIGTAPFDAGAYLITPRVAADVVAKNAASLVRSIAGIQDPASPDRPIESCRNPNGNEVVGKCANADLRRVAVTAVEGYVSTNLRSIFVQDTSDADGRYAGVKIVYNPARTNFVPSVGMYIDVTGEIIEYRGSNQIQFPTMVRNGTETASVTPVIVTNFSDLYRDRPTTRAYEGTLVRLLNVSVTQRCTEDSSQRDHGYWLVENGVLIGSAWEYSYNGDLRPAGTMCLDAEQMPTGLCSCDAMSRPNDLRNNGDVFTSITGVVDYAFGEYKVEPRGDADLVR